MPEATRTIKSKPGALFRRAGGFISRHKKWFIILAILIIAAIVVLVLLFSGRSNMAAGLQAPQTTALAKTDLQQVVSATGTLQSASTREVTSSLSYDILEIYVEEGDKVEQGDLLAQLDASALDENIADVKKSISEAAQSDALALSQAERKLQDAINARDINSDKNDKAVQSAYDALEAARQRETAAKTSYDNMMRQKKADTALADADTAMKAAQAALKAAQDGFVADSTTANEEALALAQSAYDTAKGQYDALNAPYEAAAASYSSASASIPTLESTYSSVVQTRDASLRSDNISIENAQDTVNTQKLKDSASSYRTQLESYEEEKEKCRIEAPVSGTITSMSAAVGQSAGGLSGTTAASTALFTIEATNRLEITTSIPEYDVLDLRTGLSAIITSDAVSDAEWRGSVKSISAKATDSSGNFTVVVELTSPVGDLAIGMSTKVNIITESKNSVYAVPYDAVTTSGTGENVIYLWTQEDGQQPAASASGSEAAPPLTMGRPIVVETGMETDYYIEIISDELEDGMLILTDPEGNNISTTSTGFGGMGGGMVFGG